MSYVASHVPPSVSSSPVTSTASGSISRRHNPNPSVEWEPDEAFKESLRRRIHENLKEMVTNAHETRDRNLADDPANAEEHQKTYRSTMDELNHLAEESFQAELQHEREARRWSSGTSAPPAWLLSEQQAIWDKVKQESEGLAPQRGSPQSPPPPPPPDTAAASAVTAGTPSIAVPPSTGRSRTLSQVRTPDALDEGPSRSYTERRSSLTTPKTIPEIWRPSVTPDEDARLNRTPQRRGSTASVRSVGSVGSVSQRLPTTPSIPENDVVWGAEDSRARRREMESPRNVRERTSTSQLRDASSLRDRTSSGALRSNNTDSPQPARQGRYSSGYRNPDIAESPTQSSSFAKDSPISSSFEDHRSRSAKNPSRDWMPGSQSPSSTKSILSQSPSKASPSSLNTPPRASTSAQPSQPWASTSTEFSSNARSRTYSTYGQEKVSPSVATKPRTSSSRKSPSREPGRKSPSPQRSSQSKSRITGFQPAKAGAAPMEINDFSVTAEKPQAVLSPDRPSLLSKGRPNSERTQSLFSSDKPPSIPFGPIEQPPLASQQPQSYLSQGRLPSTPLGNGSKRPTNVRGASYSGDMVSSRSGELRAPLLGERGGPSVAPAPSPAPERRGVPIRSNRVSMDSSNTPMRPTYASGAPTIPYETPGQRAFDSPSRPAYGISGKRSQEMPAGRTYDSPSRPAYGPLGRRRHETPGRRGYDRRPYDIAGSPSSTTSHTSTGSQPIPVPPRSRPVSDDEEAEESGTDEEAESHDDDDDDDDEQTTGSETESEDGFDEALPFAMQDDPADAFSTVRGNPFAPRTEPLPTPSKEYEMWVPKTGPPILRRQTSATKDESGSYPDRTAIPSTSGRS
ncbi:hypothetical protein K523DRAFT_192453, partial [Schizophyllum commune Tattone D]